MTTTPERQLPSQPFRFPNRRTALLIAGVLTLGIGAALNWNWLIAAGIGPIVLSILPCAVMCLLGVCLHKCQGKAAPDNVDKGGKQSLCPSRVDDRRHPRSTTAEEASRLFQAGC